MTALDPKLERQFKRIYPAPDIEPNWDAVVAASAQPRWLHDRRRWAGSRRRSAALVIAVSTLLGAGTALGYGIAHLHHAQSTWLVIINDYVSDGRLDKHYSCADLTNAINHVSSKSFPTVVAALRHERELSCSTHRSLQEHGGSTHPGRHRLRSW